jgi:hypothetical protein
MTDRENSFICLNFTFKWMAISAGSQARDNDTQNFLGIKAVAKKNPN